VVSDFKLQFTSCKSMVDMERTCFLSSFTLIVGEKITCIWLSNT